jgi:hypothetical protein
MRPAFSRQQPHQTAAIEIALHLVEGRARHAEQRGRFGDGLALGPHAPKHLVFDLHQRGVENAELGLLPRLPDTADEREDFRSVEVPHSCVRNSRPGAR